MEEPKYYELWCGDGDYYHLTEKAKLELDQYLKENNVTYKNIDIDVIPVKLMDHMPSIIDFYIEEFKKSIEVWSSFQNKKEDTNAKV